MKICIHVISSRTKCLKLSLQSFYKHFNNNKYQFEVYIYHFDNIYSDEYIKDIHDTISPNIKFIEIDYGIPAHLNYNQLYFARVHPGRIGYHHMCHFWSNYYYYPKTEYKKYDIGLQFNDEAKWIKDFPNELIDKFIESNSVLMVTNPYKYNVNHRSRGVRIGLCSLVKFYCNKYKIIPKNEWLKNLLKISDKRKVEDFFQTNLVCYDTPFTKLEIFKTQNYKNWMHEVNLSGGIYKYRWGDNEVISLFHDLHYENPILLNPIKQNGGGTPSIYINCGGFRHITDLAPSVRNPRKHY